MKKTKNGYAYDLKTLAPIDKDDAIEFVKKWKNKSPNNKIIYVEFTINDVLSLFARNALKFPTHIRIYNAINYSGDHTQVLVTSRKNANDITIETNALDNDYGEDFGTLSPPAGNYEIDDNSLAALAMKKSKPAKSKKKTANRVHKSA